MSGKRTGRHPVNELTPLKVKRLKEPGDYPDGNCLYLRITDTGSKQWIMKLMIQGRRRYPGLGSVQLVTLEEARELARWYRKEARAGRDPIAERRKAQPAPTFEALATQLFENKKAEWKNAKHRSQWIGTLTAYALPKIGRMPVNTIGTDDVLSVLEPIWQEKPETASRTRQRVESVLDYASAKGFRSGDNPARWAGHLEHTLAKPSKRTIKHFAALDWRELPEFMTGLSKREGGAARGLGWGILNNARPGEVRDATWSEIDLQDGVWIIPAERMKAGKEHRVPLTPQALALLGKPGKATDLLFKNPAGGKLSDTAFARLLARMGRGDLTSHGFRSTFRDWAGETTAHPREVIEHALAHKLKDKAEAAYARGDLFQKRRVLMQDWANYATGSSGTVTVLRRHA